MGVLAHCRIENQKTAMGRGFVQLAEDADNLLKLGMSLAALENKDDACASFGELDTRFPDADPRLRRQADQQKEKLSCP